MLNLYKYHDTPDTLPLFLTLSHRMNLLDDYDDWGEKISADDLEPLMGVIKNDPKLAFMYVANIKRSRMKDAESVIKTSPPYASMYAQYFLSKDPEWMGQPGHENGRWPEAEPYIMKDSYSAYNYAKGVIQGRWLEAEPYIKQNKDDWYRYTREFEVE